MVAPPEQTSFWQIGNCCRYQNALQRSGERISLFAGSSPPDTSSALHIRTFATITFSATPAPGDFSLAQMCVSGAVVILELKANVIQSHDTPLYRMGIMQPKSEMVRPIRLLG